MTGKQKGRIAILHYASPPGVGGVEATIAYHARALADLGYGVRTLTGNGASFDSRIETAVNPLFGSAHPDILRLKKVLDSGNVPAEFEALVEKISADLQKVLSGCQVCIAHNVPTLHKNLPLTAALAALTTENKIRLIAWCHDLAWTNTQYLPELHEGYPWDLLRQPWPNTTYVTVSEARRGEVAGLLKIAPESVQVVVPGVDPARFFHWTATTERLERSLHLLDADGLLLLPARITRRKNIEMGLRILAELRQQSSCDYRLIVTGPPGPHNPANPGYLGELLALRRELGIEESAHFLYAYGAEGETLIPDDDTMANLYQLADALLFPSTQEGFGIPMLEAGLAGIPIFCADIPALRHTGGADAYYFDPVKGSAEDIASAIRQTLDNSPMHRLRLRVRRHYRWEALVRVLIVPLLEMGNA